MKEENTEFSIPENFLSQIYEFSGGVDKYKGMILALCNEKGEPTIYSQYDSTVVEMGLKCCLQKYIENPPEMKSK